MGDSIADTEEVRDDLLKIAFGSFLCVAITRRLPQLFAAPQAE